MAEASGLQMHPKANAGGDHRDLTSEPEEDASSFTLPNVEKEIKTISERDKLGRLGTRYGATRSPVSFQAKPQLPSLADIIGSPRWAPAAPFQSFHYTSETSPWVQDTLSSNVQSGIQTFTVPTLPASLLAQFPRPHPHSESFDPTLVLERGAESEGNTWPKDIPVAGRRQVLAKTVASVTIAQLHCSPEGSWN